MVTRTKGKFCIWMVFKLYNCCVDVAAKKKMSVLLFFKHLMNDS